MAPSSKKYTSLDEFISKDAPICYGILKPGNSVPGGVPVVKVKDISNGRIRSDGLLHASPEIDRQYERSRLNEGDILLTIRGTTGRTAIVPPELHGANITQDTARIRVASDNSRDFVLYALQSDGVQRQININTIGQAVKGINIAEVRKLRLFHPGKKSQIRIAEILSTWDQAIETTEELVNNSKAHRKALKQRLLTGKERFSPFIVTNEKRETKYGSLPRDWSFVPIGKVAAEESERAGENTDLPVLSCSKHDGFVDSLEYFKKKVFSDDTSNYKVVRRGSYGFPSNHIEEGSIGYQDICEAGIVSPIYSVFKTSDQVHDGYLFRLLKTEHYRQIFAARTNASVDRRGSLRWREFSKIRVPLPSLAEQQKISETIDAADKELDNLRAQSARLQLEKRALMQELLTGKRRVKVAA